MIVFRAGIRLNAAHRSSVLCSLRRVLGQTRVLPGCVSCHLHADVEDANRLLLVEEWENMQGLRNYLGTESFRVVLSALDCASQEPEVRFDTVSETSGIEFVSACRRLEEIRQ